MDANLKKYIDKYDKWLGEKTISFSSRVIPVAESIESVQQLIPSMQAVDILKGAKTITLAKCICRQRYKNCDRPQEVCFVLNEAGEKWARQGLSRKINLDEAIAVAGEANSNGLVHLTLYKPDHEIFALCSCCSCCCHDLQLVLSCGKDYLLAKSDFIAVDDPDDCIDCGACMDRCQFNARKMEGGAMLYDDRLCRGCGLCITSCPQESIEMAPKA